PPVKPDTMSVISIPGPNGPILRTVRSDDLKYNPMGRILNAPPGTKVVDTFTGTKKAALTPGGVAPPAQPAETFHPPMSLPDQSGGQMHFDLSGAAGGGVQSPAMAIGAESPARKTARAKLKANGYSDAKATQELDRLGVK